MPKKTFENSTRIVAEGKTQVNFNIDNNLLEQVRDLSYWENISNSDVYSLGTQRYIEAYVKKHGKIRPRPEKGKGLKGL